MSKRTFPSNSINNRNKYSPICQLTDQSTIVQSQYTEGKCLNHGTKHCRNNQLQNMEHPYTLTDNIHFAQRRFMVISSYHQNRHVDALMN